MRLAALAALALVAAACGGSNHATTTPTPSGTVWLCRPGLAANPCTSSLTTTVVEPGGATHVERAVPAANPPVDCFYVYPTVSAQKTVNASLVAGFREREVAIAQASRFSQVCKVYAPAYRQITLSALEHPAQITLRDALLAYRGVASAFRDYLAHYNDGRGIVFIGHSQGATILTRLLRLEVDGNPSLRARLVSALLLGGNVTMGPTGDFRHIPACTRAREAGCVVAYSSFATKPSTNALFGRTTSDAGLRLLAPRRLAAGVRIVCVNPAAPGGGGAPLDPYIPSLALAFLPRGKRLTVKTPWVSFPGEYTGRCESSGNASWLQITRASRTGPQLGRLDNSLLGLHVLDVNIALGDLVRLVRDVASAYSRR